jgi:hypothetical protein
LAIAVGERVGLIGALSIETAARYLAAREVDGIIIGDGFSTRVVDAFLTAIAEDVRFRETPVAVVAAHADVTEHHGDLPHLEQIEGTPAQVLDWMLPLVRLRAFSARLARMLKALDAEGTLDPETGLLTGEAFRHELAHAVEDAGRRGCGLCIARFAFEPPLDRRASVDAARMVGMAIRNIDFAWRAPDGSILMALADTELRSAHIVARRVGARLRATMIASGVAVARPIPAITLATLKPSDTLDSLVARIGGTVAAA